MKAAVRCNSLDAAGLAAQEAHGKRCDRTSAMRRVRDADPLIYGTLDLSDAFSEHMEGVKQNAGCKKPVLHFIVRFPPELLEDDAGQFTGSREERQRKMLDQARAFVDETHGGNAVFAARVDRDERGETVVDVFAAPRYEKRTKRTKPDQEGPIWASPTKFGKELAEKHSDEIRRRHPEAKGNLTSPRAVGIALQSEFSRFFERENGISLDAKKEKAERGPDRLETEAYKALEEQRAEIAAERSRLQRIGDTVSGLVGSLADRLGVRRDLAAVSEALTEVDDPLSGSDPEPADVGSPSDIARMIEEARGKTPDSDGPDIEM